MKCLACGIEKDPDALEVYPFPEEAAVCDDPISPLMGLDCQPAELGKGLQWKRVIVCHLCFHKLAPDMWISRRCWDSLDPVTPYEQLPNLEK